MPDNPFPKRFVRIAIDSATYLLTISSPDINKVASNEPLGHHNPFCHVAIDGIALTNRLSCNLAT